MCSRTERGAGLFEFAVTAPVLLLMLAGLVELGTLFQSVPWISQTAYNMTKAGAESPPDYAPRLMRERGQMLIDAHTRPNRIQITLCQGDSEYVTAPKPQTASLFAPRDFAPSVCAEVRSVFGFKYSFEIAVAGSSLFTTANSGNVNLAVFEDDLT